jgi:hypothetical protein
MIYFGVGLFFFATNSLKHQNPLKKIKIIGNITSDLVWF